MNEGPIILNANIGKTNVIDFEDFYEIAVDTVEEIAKLITPLCGRDALHDLVIYRHRADQYLRNVFSNDGIHILKSIEYMSPIQTYITNYICYVAERVEKAAGDGTSTAIFLASKMIASVLKEVADIRKNHEVKCRCDKAAACRFTMVDIKQFSERVVGILKDLLKRVEASKIDVNEVDVEQKEMLIKQLAYTTSKGNKILTDYAVELFRDLPELLYEYTHYKDLNIETEEDFTIERVTDDFKLKMLLSNNTQLNSKLNTELFYENCDLLVCPNIYGRVDILLQYLKQRESDKHLVLIYSGGDPSEEVMLETKIDRTKVSFGRNTSTVFANNPLELRTLLAVAGKNPVIQETLDDFGASLIEDVACRSYDNMLYISNLFDTSTSPMHPSYVRKDHPAYTKLQQEIEVLIKTLKEGLSNQAVNELNEFIRIYRNMICSKMSILTIGGSTTNHLANINVVNDVLGVVSVAMKRGVVLDIVPKLYHYLDIGVDSVHLTNLKEDINDYCLITYQDASVCFCYPEELSNSNTFYNQDTGTWMLMSSIEQPKVVQSYKAIEETLKRLLETIPRLICTDKIIVHDSVMGD